MFSTSEDGFNPHITPIGLICVVQQAFAQSDYSRCSDMTGEVWEQGQETSKAEEERKDVDSRNIIPFRKPAA
ncbi:hypothetical protein AtubIFM55763_004710 [Aspergillus tubingensis]|uniref:uncharacterized protein n=1 Tax=Aspergillus tubingensis TaxID=5068 RepID=UPI001578696B|nr:uncharacterized protein AtWU_01812 [Aspergillus tubingensis]GFN12015.1 hypothetical protein AtWU_01812 [Aspergillus tubingensis]GLA73778.1 hypothetical protein AtubIFM55763_004710 [Aspergillus tubingensis]